MQTTTIDLTDSPEKELLAVFCVEETMKANRLIVVSLRVDHHVCLVQNEHLEDEEEGVEEEKQRRGGSGGEDEEEGD